MDIILLSGGSGKRLWPLSNNIRSKQFIKFLKKPDGSYESMVQRVFRQLNEIEETDITIATAKSQVSEIRNQLGDKVGISVEPCRRDTFPAIVLAAAYLKDVKKKDENSVVIICPVDPDVDVDYFKCFKKLENQVLNGADIALIGITPTYPSEKYGYIIPEGEGEISSVKEFKEKPTESIAKKYIAQGALWNGGVFCLRIKSILQKANEIIGFCDYDTLLAQYDKLQKISFDYAVVEKSDNIKVVRFNGKWKDIGTWNTLSESMEDNILGKAILGDKCENVHIINELSVPILAMGLKDVVISASPEGVLVSDKETSSYIKPYVDKIDNQIMYAEKSWGNYKVINIEDESLTLLVTLNANSSMHYHSHKNRDEVWVVISGEGIVSLDGNKKNVKCGDIVEMKANGKHKISAITDLKLIEVQLGKDITVLDKQKFDE